MSDRESELSTSFFSEESKGVDTTIGKGSTELSPAFLSFLKENEVSPEVYVNSNKIPRFIRLGSRCQLSLKELETELGTRLLPTPLPKMFQLEQDRGIASTSSYKRGLIYGIDLASAFAVHALNLKPGHHALDLCCAPGAKLCMMAETVANNAHSKAKNDRTNHNHNKQATGSVTGVDIARQRLNVCRNLIRKYKVMGIRLYCADGTSFALPPSKSPIRHNRIVDLLNPNSNKRTRDGNRKTDKDEPSSSSGIASDTLGVLVGGYDRVLVDAECTHDGSMKHIQKYQNTAWEGFERKVLDPKRLGALQKLQRSLLANGFKLLKPGGLLVYSTCSFCRAQNENIVRWLLDTHPTAKLTSPPKLHLEKHRFPPTKGSLEGTLRFDPITSNTSGFFLARLTKVTDEEVKERADEGDQNADRRT